MSGDNEEEFKEFPGLPERLGRADFSGESRVRDDLKARLLARAEKRARRGRFVWLLPAAALATALILVNVLRHRPLPPPGPAYAYSLPSDGYGDCGRRGLPDYTTEGRF